jgi:glucose-induced degradation protein 8
MALMIFPQEKMTTEFKELLDLKLREKVASDVNKAMLEARGERQEAKIRQLVRARMWAEVQAREANVSLPKPFPIGLHPDDFGEIPPDAMVT